MLRVACKGDLLGTSQIDRHQRHGQLDHPRLVDDDLQTWLQSVCTVLMKEQKMSTASLTTDDESER